MADRFVAEHLAGLCEAGRPSRAVFELRVLAPGDAGIAFRRILEARLVRDFAAAGIARVVRSSERFRTDFASFDLSRTEGYLMSFLDRPMRLEKLLLASTLGRFGTFLALAHL